MKLGIKLVQGLVAEGNGPLFAGFDMIILSVSKI
jgi:hypothetical protein